MGAPFWVTGDPTIGGLQASPLKYGQHPDHNFYVWDPNPDVVPSSGIPVCITVHGGSNATGSGFSSSSAVPLGWANNVGGQYSWEANSESFPMYVVPLDYPMAVSLWINQGAKARPLKVHNEPEASIRAIRLAIQHVKRLCRAKVAPFDRANPDLVYVYATSAGLTWAMSAIFGPSPSRVPSGEDSRVPFLVGSSAAFDINEHVPSLSGTRWMLAGWQRALDQDIAAADALASKGAAKRRPDEPTTGPGAANIGLHPSASNELRRALSRDPERYGGIHLLTVYASNSNPTAAPPWRRAHDAGQGVFLHDYLDSEPLYTGIHTHLANSELASGTGESDLDDELPDRPWAFEFGASGVPGYQLQWEWITARLVELGATGDPTPGDGGGGTGVDIDPETDGFLLEDDTKGIDFYALEDESGAYVAELEDDPGGGGGGNPDGPTDFAYLIEGADGYYIWEDLDLDGTNLYYLSEETGPGTPDSELYLNEDEFLVLQEDGASAHQLETADG